MARTAITRPTSTAWAREGMLFRNAMVTNSICAPSRAVIQTGKYSHLNTVLDNRNVFDGSQQTFPKLLRQAGYQTAIVGKWHLKSEPTGFDYWEILPGQGELQQPRPRPARKAARSTLQGLRHRCRHGSLALNWLENERDKSQAISPDDVPAQGSAPQLDLRRPGI